MKQENIELFNKAIHNVKKILLEVTNERKRYHSKLNKLMMSIKKLRNSHDKKMNSLFNEQKEVLEEMYELFERFDNEEK